MNLEKWRKKKTRKLIIDVEQFLNKHPKGILYLKSNFGSSQVHELFLW